jgi:hypothetical protein
MTSNIDISEVDAFMYVVLSKAEKHVPYGKLVIWEISWYHKMFNAIRVYKVTQKAGFFRNEFNCTCSKDDDLNKLESPLY